VLFGARIMGRRRSEVNGSGVELGTESRVWIAALALVAVSMAFVSCGGGERRADRLWREAVDRAGNNDTEGAVRLMQKIIDDYPDTPVAAKARDQIVVYRGLAHAVQTYPMRRARELMVHVARAVETYRHQKGRPPASLDDLVPALLPALPQDPWGRPFRYALEGKTYRLHCDGADGVPGGTGDDADLVVVDGDFVTAPS
jgi:Type II secretion system (T2SS), protein G